MHGSYLSLSSIIIDLHLTGAIDNFRGTMLPNSDLDNDQLVQKGRAEVKRGLERIKGQGTSTGQAGDPQDQVHDGQGQQYPQNTHGGIQVPAAQGGHEGEIRPAGYPPGQSQAGSQQYPQPVLGHGGFPQAIRQSELGPNPQQGVAGGQVGRGQQYPQGPQSGVPGQVGPPRQSEFGPDGGAPGDINQPGGQNAGERLLIIDRSIS